MNFLFTVRIRVIAKLQTRISRKDKNCTYAGGPPSPLYQRRIQQFGNTGFPQWRGVNCDVSIVMPCKPMVKNRLLRCSLRTPYLSILFRRFKWHKNRYIAKHATPLDSLHATSNNRFLSELFAPPGIDTFPLVNGEKTMLPICWVRQYLIQRYNALLITFRKCKILYQNTIFKLKMERKSPPKFAAQSRSSTTMLLAHCIHCFFRYNKSTHSAPRPLEAGAQRGGKPAHGPVL